MICIMIMKEAARMSSLFRSLNKNEKEKENLRKISPARPGRQSRPKTAPAKSKKVSLLFLTENNFDYVFFFKICAPFLGELSSQSARLRRAIPQAREREPGPLR